MAVMYQRVVAVITKPPEERTLREIEPLLPWIRKKSELINSLKEDVVVDIIRNCAFVTCHRDHIIIKQGEKGDCFYIMLTGKVSVFINQVIADEEAGTEELTLTHKGGNLDRSKFGNFIAHIDGGKSFGELALINKDCVRNASIIADETTDLLVVNRELYNRSLRAAQAAEYEERKNFIAEHSLFHNWQQRYKKQIAMSLKKEVIQFDGYIAKQGEPAVVLYFILRGTAKIVVDPSHHPSQYPQLLSGDDPDVMEKAELLESFILGDVAQKGDRPSALLPSAQRRRETRRKSVEVSLVGANEIIGDVEFGLELGTYMQSVICMQKCEVYTLNMKNYERLVLKRNKPTVEQMRENAATKLASRVSRLTEFQVPLYRVLLYKICSSQQKVQKDSRRKRDAKGFGDEESPFDDIVPPRGPLIDLFGPGTVFYRSRMREQAKQRQQRHKQGNGFRGNVTYTAAAPVPAAGVYGIADFESLHDYASDSNHTGYHHDGNLMRGREEEELEGHISSGRGKKPRRQFHDWGSSDRALSMLEEKIKQWHAGITSKPPKDTIKLRRVTVEEGREVKPGKKIFLRLKNSGGDHADNVTASDSNLLNNLSPGRLAKSHSETAAGSDDREDIINDQFVSDKLSIKQCENRGKHQYTAEEYKQLKNLMLSKERTIGAVIF